MRIYGLCALPSGSPPYRRNRLTTMDYGRFFSGAFLVGRLPGSLDRLIRSVGVGRRVSGTALRWGSGAGGFGRIGALRVATGWREPSVWLLDCGNFMRRTCVSPRAVLADLAPGASFEARIRWRSPSKEDVLLARITCSGLVFTNRTSVDLVRLYSASGMAIETVVP